MQNIEDILIIGRCVLGSQAQEQALEEAYNRNQLNQGLEDLLLARRLTEQLTTEYLDAIAGLNPHPLPLQASTEILLRIFPIPSD